MDATPAAPPPLAAPPPPAPPPTAGYERAGFISRLTYHFVGELIAEARAGGLEDEAGALKYLPTADRAEQLAANFDAAWRGARAARPARAPAAAMWAAFWRAHSVHYVTYAAWSVLELGVVVGSPLLLRQFLDWYSAAAAGGAGAPPVWEGWAWAAALAAFSYCYTLVHHQLFFRGYRNGLRMRAAAVCAVQAKALRLSAAAAAAVSQGTLVNLVSNDVRRFEEFGIFWVFLVTGPALLVLVVLLVGLRLGFPSAVAGVATLLALIPAQALLARRIGKLRGATAAATDARVRAAAEAVAGALACKMLAWEAPMLERVARARAREAALVRRMNLIRACNMALSWAITPLVILAALGTASALNVELTVATVFYSISLLALPKLYMCDFFVHAVEAVSEVRVSMRRLAAFLALPEPPPPWRAAKGEGEEGVAADAAPGEVAIELSGADFDWHEGRAAKGFGGEGSAHGPPALEAVRVDGSGSGRTGAPASPRASGAPTLRGVRLAIRRGELVAVVGAVGAGKSSLLAALLGELRPVAGTGPAGRPAVAVRAQRVAYCAQVPFIMSGTVRDNVLFGAAHEPGRYSRALAAAALGPDLARMPAGDATEIGERGVALSGGQRARLALARAAYAGAAVVLLDDPLSAVDGRVRRSLFENCVRGALAGAAVVLVTHHTAYALRCDRVVVLRGGAVAEDGPPEALRARGVPELAAAAGAGAEGAAVDDACAEAEEAAAEGAEGGVEVADVAFVEVAAGPPLPPAPEPRRGFESRALSSIRSLASLRRPRLTPAPAAPPSAASLRRFLSRRLGPGSLSTSGKRAAPGAPLAPGRLVADEGRAAGGVPWSVYAAVAQRMGITAVALVAAALLGGQALFIYSEYWLSLWASATPAEQEESKWVAAYGAFAGAILAISLARSLGFFAAALRGASALHAAAAARLLYAPLAFFHATPAGRILNRFSRDQGALDEQLPTVAWDALQAGMSVLGALVLLAVVVPAILPVFVPLVVAFFWVQRRYLVASRECKRLEAVTRSPLYASFSEALRGLPTIRAYAAGPRLRAAFLAAASRNAGWSFCWLTTARWVGFRLDLMVSLVLTAAPLLVVALRGRISPRLAALALTQSLQLAGVAQWCVRQAAEVENNMTSAERVLEYASELEQEADPGGAPPAGWPADGAVAFEDVGALYRPGLPRVLRGLTFTVAGGSGCGVVGRTGSGKSSLLLALLRLIPVVEGRVLVGGADAAALPLRALRRQVAVIPQDPVLFSGTLRSNLDPWGEHADARLWDALRAAQLDAAARAAGGLGARVAEGGDSLSAGQRQLLCLARALLADAAVLALDEATANVDAATDAAVGRAVAAARRGSLDGARGGARRRTLLVIAHRVDTIMGLDQLLVLADGALVEAGPPRELAARAGGAFAAMAGAARARGRAGSLDQ